MDQWLPMFLLFRASWQMAIRSCEPSPLLTRFGCSKTNPPHELPRRTCISRRQPSRHVAACMLVRAAGPSPPSACASDRPARLRQSLPQPGSPPARVCYGYSAQPSIAEAGLAPASMSKTEGCTWSSAFGLSDTQSTLKRELRTNPRSGPVVWRATVPRRWRRTRPGQRSRARPGIRRSALRWTGQSRGHSGGRASPSSSG